MPSVASRRILACLALTLARGSDESEGSLSWQTALEMGDECLADDPSSCALSALQLRVQKAKGEATTVDADSEDSMELSEETKAAAEAWQAELLERYNISVPSIATQYDGVAWPAFSAIQSERHEIHIFAIGDWGALLPTHKTAPNHRMHLPCPDLCGYMYGIDDKAQLLVADQVRLRAEQVGTPQYFLNVGDNFYWSGVKQRCGTSKADADTVRRFQMGWKDIYGSFAEVPWLSVLGNHDYGGYEFTHGWDAQIAYSFMDKNWVMPARYFSREMHHDGFSVEYFMIDSNSYDAHEPEFDPDHNICSANNVEGANCASCGGPTSVIDCKDWFWNSYVVQKAWLEKKLAESKADWQVVVTHFPCGHDSKWYSKLHNELGLDLLVTGHRHDQEIWANSKPLGGLSCFVTGGGGGVTSERTPIGFATDQYGFFDLTLSKESIRFDSVNINGIVIGSATAYPKAKLTPEQLEAYRNRFKPKNNRTTTTLTTTFVSDED